MSADTPAQQPDVEPVPDAVATPWRDLGWTDEAIAALFGGPSVEEEPR